MDQLLAVKGVGERTAAHLATLLPLFRRYQQSVCADRKKSQNRSQASAYCLALLSGWRIERFYLLSLNADMELMGTRLIAEGSLTEVSAYPRLVVEAALNHNAHSVVFCHNHPGGSLRPSADDIQTTLLPVSYTHLDSLLRGIENQLRAALGRKILLQGAHGQRPQGQGGYHQPGTSQPYPAHHCPTCPAR